MYEMLFHYYPAFVARVIEATRVQIWLQHPRNAHINYDLKRTIVVDLDKTPGNRAIQWDDIEVDDFAEHEDPERRGFTTLGPVFPHNYGAVGVYISASYRDRYEGQLTYALWRPSANAAVFAKVLVGRPYEEVSVVRKDGATLRRFHGFHRLEQHQVPGSDRKLYIVAHAGTSGSKRARCPVVINLGDAAIDVEEWRELPEVGKQTMDTGADGQDAGPVYISQATAAEAGLEIPKKPTGSGEGLMTDDERHPAASKPRCGGPLNVFGEGAYDEVARIQDRLRGNYIVVGRHNLSAELLELTKPINPRATFTSLDLIGHSRARDGVLRFNDLALEKAMIPYIFTEAVIGILDQLSIKEVRFLGCRTTTSPTALDALREVQARLIRYKTNIKVRGTTGDLFAVHYARGTGFMETRLLCGTDACEAAAHDPPGNQTPLETLPLASESSSNIEDSRFWASAPTRFNELWGCVDRDSDPTYSAGPLEEAGAQVLCIDPKHKIRAFDLIPVSPQGAKNRPLKGIRLNFAAEWRFHRVLDPYSSDKLYALIKE